MNHSAHQPYAPQAQTLPRDAVQVQAFAAASEMNFKYLNANLGLSLDPLQYRRLQYHFYHIEKRNPTLGELRLTGALMERLSLSECLAPTELYTDSEVIMDTWADIMDGITSVYEEINEPCTLARVLSLPEAYLKRRGDRRVTTDVPRVTSSAETALADGYVPSVTLHTASGTSRQLWAKSKRIGTTAPAQIGDVILAVQPAEIQAIVAFLEGMPQANVIKTLAVIGRRSLLVSALELCGGRGLTVDLNTLVPAHPPKESRMAAYLSNWELTPPSGKAYAVFCIPPYAQEPLFTALSDHGFTPCLLGTVIKQPRIVFTDGILNVVNLHRDLILKPQAIKPYRALLPVPGPIGKKAEFECKMTPPLRLSEMGCTVADLTATLSGEQTDGFTPALQSVLSLCGEFASAGIRYDTLSLSPILYFDGNTDAPLLLSAVCGLYRACTELGIPMICPEILFKNRSEASEKTSLVLSLVAYTPKEPVCPPRTLVEKDAPLGLMTLDECPRWEDIRGLLFSVATAVESKTLSAAHSLNGRSVLTLLSHLASPEVALTAGLFEEQKEIVSIPFPLAFLTEGPIPQGGLHVGVTCPRPEDAPLPPAQAPEPDGFTLIPYPTVTLQEMKNKETQRRKEIAAMEKIKAFEPLCQNPRTVLLDTDIGPDCDDVGALAVLIYYAKQYGFPIGGICNCTSNKAGNGVIDAVCRRCGMDTPPLGQWSGEGFMDGQEHCKYNTAVAEAHSEAYRNGTLAVDDEVTYYRKRLAEAKDGDVMVISIGMFNNLAALLESPADDISPLSGMELVKAKVYALVSMAAILPQGRECNVVSDYKSCEKVFASWPTPIYLSDFHIGVNVKTGYSHITDPEAIMADPLPMSYHLYTKEWNWEGAVKGQNASYDLTAVQFAALGICDLYDLDTPGDLEFYAEIPALPDATRFVANPMGNKIFMTKKVADEVIADSLQQILNSF
ncbi:MAG: hypothetical protein IJW00_02595 [Clostridia bacterium]|nr:hypothetical protein [Clostridia bacterium]